MNIAIPIAPPPPIIASPASASPSSSDNDSLFPTELAKAQTQTAPPPPAPQPAPQPAAPKQADSTDESDDANAPVAKSDSTDKTKPTTAQPAKANTPAQAADPSQRDHEIAPTDPNADDQQLEHHPIATDQETTVAEQTLATEQAVETKDPAITSASATPAAPVAIKKSKTDAAAQSPSAADQAAQAAANGVNIIQAVTPNNGDASQGNPQQTPDRGNGKIDADLPGKSRALAQDAQSTQNAGQATAKSNPAIVADASDNLKNQPATKFAVKLDPNSAAPIIAQTPANPLQGNQSVAPAAPPAPTPTAQFAQSNQQTIVTGIKGELLPDGGTMQINLSPPELGAMQVTVKVQDGAVWASFQTTNDDATRLLTHSLSQLRDALETQGVSVQRLHVQQTTKPESQGNNSSDDNNRNSTGFDDRSARQEQQRREMLRRMWAKLSTNGQDPLDLVA